LHTAKITAKKKGSQLNDRLRVTVAVKKKQGVAPAMIHLKILVIFYLMIHLRFLVIL
jgi:hypothetical protein